MPRVQRRHPVTGARLSISRDSDLEVQATDARLAQIRSALAIGAIGADEADRLVESALADTSGARAATVTTVAQIWERYLGTVSGTAKKGIVSAGRSRILPAFGRLLPSQITTELMVTWYTDQRAQKAEKTVRNAYDLLCSALRRVGKLTKMPWDPWRPKTPRHKPRLDGARSIESVVALYRAAREIDERNASGVYPTSYAAIVLVGAYTGLRTSEMAGLGWQDIDLDHPSVQVARFWRQAEQGWQRDGALAPSRQMKSDREPHILHPDVVECLRRHREQLRSAGAYRPDGPVFPVGRSGKWRTSGRIMKPEQMREIAKAAGIPCSAAWRVHSLRATAVTLEALVSGIRGAMSRIGHHSVDMVAGYLREAGVGPQHSRVPGISELGVVIGQAIHDRRTTVPQLAAPQLATEWEPVVSGHRGVSDASEELAEHASALRAESRKAKRELGRMPFGAVAERAVKTGKGIAPRKGAGARDPSLPEEVKEAMRGAYVRAYVAAKRGGAAPEVCAAKGNAAKVRCKGSWVAQLNRAKKIAGTS